MHQLLPKTSMTTPYLFRIFVIGFVLVTAPSLWAKKSEAELIEMLKSRNYHNVIDALDRLPNLYPKSTAALPAIKELLKSKDLFGKDVPPNMGPNFLARKAARALGLYRADVSAADLKFIYEFLKARDPNEVMDGLKALRGLSAPGAVAEIVPLLKDENEHIVRDSCRTLAILGNKDTIPVLEPLLKHSKFAVRGDARDAIAKLRAAP
jgi:HEAT repeat protein